MNSVLLKKTQTRNLLWCSVTSLLILLIPIVGTAQNCDCTVSQVNSNSVSPCTEIIGTAVTVSTVNEFQSAISQANSSGGNMTILIADGDYQIASTSSFPYITGSNIVIRSLNGNRDAVIVRGSGNNYNYGTEDGFLIAGNNVTIADLTIQEVGNHGIQVSGHNLYVHNVKFQDIYEQMIKGSSTAATIDSALVQCSLFQYTQGIGPNWYIGGIDGHKSHGWIVRDNVFKDISSPGISLAEHAVHFWNNSANNIVERNMIYNCDRGIGFGLGNSAPQNTGGIIRNNMIYNDGSNIYDDVGIGLERSPNTRVYNNTVIIDYFNAIEYRFSATTNVDIVNNLTNQAISSRDGGTASLQTNVTNAQDGWFIDVNTGDLHLSSMETTVVDQGTNLPLYVTEDIDQTARPMNSQTDIGAHETLLTGILLSPNCIEVLSDPANGIYTIRGSLSQYVIDVLDINGVVLQTIPSSGFSTSLNLSSLPSSYYFIRIINSANGDVSVQKIILP